MRARNDLNKSVLGIIALALFMLAGCGAQSVDFTREPAGCELNANAVCASAMEAYLSAEAVRQTQDAPSEGPNVIPLVAPVKLPGGELPAEVDCYVNVERFFASLRAPGNSTQFIASCVIAAQSRSVHRRVARARSRDGGNG